MPQHFLISTVDFEQAIVCWINENADEKKSLKTDNRKKEGSNIDEERSGEKSFVSVNKNVLVRKNMVTETLLS